MKRYFKRLFKNKTIHSITKNKAIFLIMIALSTMFLGVGYAQISDIQLNVYGSASAEASENVVITRVAYDSDNNADSSNSTINYTNLTLMNSKIVLGNDLLSTITYKVTIKNNTDIDAIFNDAIFIQPTGYDNTDIEFVLSGINNGDIISPGQRKEFNITFKYKDSISRITNNTLNSQINFRFNLENKVAKIGSVYYETLQQAINAAQTDTMTIIELLCDRSENITVDEGKFIEIQLRNNALSNVGNAPVVENNGYLVFKNGIIRSDATGNGAINNRATGTVVLDSIIADVTGGKQALYNDSGTATITGNTYIRTTSNQRGAVQSLAGGTLNIESGTIISTRHNGVVNAGTMNIGLNDGSVTESTPVIIGSFYGVTSETYYNFYDGIAKGKEFGLNNTGRALTEQGYDIVISDETIDGTLYHTCFPAISVTVTFEPGVDATVDEPTRNVAVGHKVGDFPAAVRNGYDLIGWFTAPDGGGEEVSASTIINDDITFYAYWEVQTSVCYIGTTGYSSIANAITAAPANTQTTIVLQKNTQENEITIGTNKKIILDLNGHTISNATAKSIIENNGVLTIQNGTISTNSVTDGAINHNKGTLNLSANVLATGERQAIYIKAGTVNITGNPTLSSYAIGIGLNSTLGRSTIQCLSGAYLNILGGTIISYTQEAISNEGTLTIGSKDENVNNSIPTIRGETTGVATTSTFNFYDGTIMGINDALSGTITDTETSIIDGTTVIDGKTYKTKNNS